MVGHSRYVVLLFLLVFVLRAQTQDLPQSSDQNKTYPLAGTVVNSMSGRPIARALVRLAQFPGRAVLSGQQGDFSFDNVPQGTTEVLVTKPGYFHSGPGSANYLSSAGNSLPYRVEIGPDTGNVVLKLAPEAMISGSIEGEDEEPVEGVMVEVLRSQIIEGRRQLVLARRSVTSDEDGNFRIAGLPPGRYYMCVRASQSSRLALAARSASEGEVYPALTYFPSSPDVAGAAPLDLTAGQHQEAHFTLKMVPSYKVAGVVANAGEWKQVNQPMLLDEFQRPLFGPDRFDRQSGVFEFRAVPAGSYWLQFGARDGAGQYFPTYRRLLVQSNIADLRLSVQPGLDIPVVVHTEFVKGGAPKGHCTYSSDGQVHESDCTDYPAAHVELHSLDFINVRFHSDGGPLKAGFSVHGVSPGRYTVHATAAFGGYIQSARCGNLDLLHEPLVVPEGGNPGPIEVVVRDDSASLKIQVRTDKPGQQTLVLVFPDPVTMPEPQAWATTQGGEMYAGSLAPGAYKIFAFDAADGFDYSNLEALEKYASQATSVKVGASEDANVVVELIHTGE